MPDFVINDLVNKALFDYANLAGLDENSYHDASVIEALNESREMDPTGLTTAMMIRGLLDHFMENHQYSAALVIREPEVFQQSIAGICKVLAATEHPEVVRLISEYQNTLRSMARRFEVPAFEDFNSLLDNKYDLAFIRRDALRSIDSLQAFQFSQGKHEANSLQVNTMVYEFWNVNSLLAALRDQRIDGVSLCLIRDPAETMASYFVFAIKNGENITILTDREQGPHPMYWRMSRRPDRALERRAARNWLPYHLLDLVPMTGIGPDGTECVKGMRAKTPTQLVPYNTSSIALKPIGELYPEEVLWTGLLFDLINDRYGRQHLQLPELAYTGEMVANRHALIAPEAALVKSGQYRTLDLAPLTRKDVTSDTTAPQWETEPGTHNEWMVERYSGIVPEDVLNLVGERPRLLANKTHKQLLSGGDSDMVGGRLWHRPDTSLETLNPVTFGTAEEIEKDRLWVARVNQCSAIQAAAEREFKKELPKVRAWAKERIAVNRQKLIDAAVAGELILPTVRAPSSFENNVMLHSDTNGVVQYPDTHFRGMFLLSEALMLGTWFSPKQGYTRYHCALIPGRTATIFTQIQPTCPEALAIIFAVAVTDLPWGLQHWFKDTPYTGNSILNRLDPIDWKLNNPWGQYDPTVYIALSKRAIHARRKELGLPRNAFSEAKASDSSS
jgi:hypothetical protein